MILQSMATLAATPATGMYVASALTSHRFNELIALDRGCQVLKRVALFGLNRIQLIRGCQRLRCDLQVGNK